MSLTSILSHPVHTQSLKKSEVDLKVSNFKAIKEPPPYGQRQNWVPRLAEDFGDGGAFPEIKVAQYPLGLGKISGEYSNNKVIPLQIDASGQIDYGVISKQGQRKDKIVHTKFNDLLPKVIYEDDESFQRPGEEEIQANTEKTRLALEKLISGKITAALPSLCAKEREQAQYIKYTPSQQGIAFNSGSKQRIIKMIELQEDPLEPPKFKTNTKIPRGPPSPPAPVLHSPPRKVTVKEQQDWKIPPCISNWKNSKGYTIPLDKRIAADGSRCQDVSINSNFSKLAEALYIADRKAREAVNIRSELEKAISVKEKEKKEEHLRALAQRAREARAGIRSEASEADDDLNERNELRYERHRERQRERNLARAGHLTRSTLDKDRDVSEKIALGLPNPNAKVSADAQFDQRLFNHSKGLDSGFGGEDTYNVYDKPWREAQSLSQNIYRPSKNIDKELYGGDLDEIIKTNRFVPDKEFKGTSSSASRRDGPVQFEKQEKDDPFNLDKFLGSVKKATKRPTDSYETSKK